MQTDSPRVAPLVSIITVMLNPGPDKARRCLQSVRAQKFQSYEHLIWDGGSTDGSVNEVRKIANGPCRLIEAKDSGIFDAMNRVAAHAAGDWLIFINADDLFVDDQVLAEFAEVAGPVDLIYGNVLAFDEQSDFSVRRGGVATLKGLRNGQMPPHQGMFTRRSRFHELGGFSTNFRRKGDYDLTCRLFSANADRCKYWDRDIAFFSLGGVSSAFTLGWRAELERLQSVKATFGTSSAVAQSLRSVIVLARNAVRWMMFRAGVLGAWRVVKRKVFTNEKKSTETRLGKLKL